MTIKDIKVKKITAEEAVRIGVDQWEVLIDEEPLEEEWLVEEQEASYIVEGEAIVTVNGEELMLTPGTLVSFPKGLSCIWKTPKYMKKTFKEGFDFEV